MGQHHQQLGQPCLLARAPSPAHILAYKLPTAVTMCMLTFWYQISLRYSTHGLPTGQHHFNPGCWIPFSPQVGKRRRDLVSWSHFICHSIPTNLSCCFWEKIHDLPDVNPLTSPNNPMQWQRDFPCYPLVLDNKVRCLAWEMVKEKGQGKWQGKKENEEFLPTRSTLRRLLPQIAHKRLSHHVQKGAHLHALGKGTSEISPPPADL